MRSQMRSEPARTGMEWERSWEPEGHFGGRPLASAAGIWGVKLNVWVIGPQAPMILKEDCSPSGLTAKVLKLFGYEGIIHVVGLSMGVMQPNGGLVDTLHIQQFNLLDDGGETGENWARELGREAAWLQQSLGSKRFRARPPGRNGRWSLIPTFKDRGLGSLWLEEGHRGHYTLGQRGGLVLR